MISLSFALIIQIALVVHVLRTGRPIYWIFLIMFLPVVGSIAYFIVELWPDLSADHRARRTLRGIRRTFDPGADLRQRQRQHQLSGSVDAARHLAGELTESGRYQEAIEHYHGVLRGLYEHDPDLLLGLAEAQFGNEEFANARDTLDRLAQHNPDFKSSDGHLLYARALEKLDKLREALDEYEAVSAYFAGAEAKLRYARLLEQQDNDDKARALYDDIVNTADLAPRHYRKAQRRWIGEARDGSKRLSEK